MNRFVTLLTPYIGKYGYWAVAAAVFPEGFGIPLPGETSLVAASVLASRGEINFAGLMAASFFAALLGNTLGYGLGYYGGRPLVLNYGHWLFVTEERLKRVEAFFTRYGPLVLLAARFIDVFRQLNGIVAGVARMPFTRFQIYNALGAAIWTGSWGSLAYFLGRSMENWHAKISGIRFILFPALLAALALLLLLKIRAGRKRSRSGAPDE